jgi:hypothetical protein
MASDQRLQNDVAEINRRAFEETAPPPST